MVEILSVYVERRTRFEEGRVNNLPKPLVAGLIAFFASFIVSAVIIPAALFTLFGMKRFMWVTIEMTLALIFLAIGIALHGKLRNLEIC